VIGIDGSCRHQSKNTPTACAVYFHPANKFNDSWMLAGKTNTSHRAELTAALMALRTAHQIRKRNPSLTESELLACGNVGPETKHRQVLIKTDSESFVEAMTLGMYTREKIDFVSARTKKPMKDADRLKSIDDEVEALNGQGVRVQFLHVPRVENAMADYLAKSRLKGTKAKPAMDFWLLNNMWWSQ
jgi:ribonuclease HI